MSLWADPAVGDPERDLLGAIFQNPLDTIDQVIGEVDATWFPTPKYRRLWEVMLALYERGELMLGDTWDTAAWVREARVQGFQRPEQAIADLHYAAQDVPASVPLFRILQPLREMHQRWDVLRVAESLRAIGKDLMLDSAERADAVDQTLASLNTMITNTPGPLTVLEREALPFDDDPWIIPNLMRRSWRNIVVAAEGDGKSTLLRQIAVCTAAGLHPFTRTAATPVRVLLIDLENSPNAGWRRVIALANRVEQTEHGQSLREGDRFRARFHPMTVNVCTPKGRSLIDSWLQLTQPDLVCVGPLYKTFARTNAHETSEEAAMRAQEFWDSRRARYGFALVMEGHAPKADRRNMTPFGSSVWMRWPELGLTLERVDPTASRSVKVVRWRGDREDTDWPSRLDAGLLWPWDGYWPNGVLREPIPG